MSGRNSVIAWLGLGGNIGDPRAAMGEALRRLDEDDAVRVRAVSPLYRTPPWGKLDQPDFLNAVAAVETELSPRALLELCLAVEAGLKRVRRERWGPRLIDMDILLYGGEEVHEPGLDIPHPRMLDRAFVMVPLSDVAPDLMLQGKPVAEWAQATDRSGIEQVTDDGRWWAA